MLGACNTCVRLQCRVTTSGATVNSWMISLFFLIYLFYSFFFILFLCIYLLYYLFFPFSPSLVCFAWFCFVAVDFVFIFYWSIFCCVLLSLSFFFFFMTRRFHFMVGLGLIFRWSENKISYLGVIYKFLSVELAVIKELFIILYI